MSLDSIESIRTEERGEDHDAQERYFEKIHDWNLPLDELRAHAEDPNVSEELRGVALSVLRSRERKSS